MHKIYIDLTGNGDNSVTLKFDQRGGRLLRDLLNNFIRDMSNMEGDNQNNPSGFAEEQQPLTDIITLKAKYVRFIDEKLITDWDCSKEIDDILCDEIQDDKACIEKDLEKTKSFLDSQIGGDHYKKYAIQPVEYNVRNNLSWIQGEVVAKITRYKDKGGVEDLDKIIHAINLLKELEYKKMY